MEKGSSGDLFDVVFKGEVAVENDSEVADVWGGRPSGIINGEAEVVSGFGEGFGTESDLSQFRKLASIHDLTSVRQLVRVM